MRFLLALVLVALTAERSFAFSMEEVTAPVTTANEAPAAEFDPYLQPVKSVEATEESERLSRRRTHLKVHQAAGLTALALTIGQVALGQYLIGEKQAGRLGTDYDQLQTIHLATGISAFAAYSVAAGAAISAPKLEGEEKFSTISIHKGLALIHATGMIVTPVLGWYMTEKREEDPGAVDEIDRLNTIHQVTGYTTAAALAGAFVVITLR